MNRYESYVNTGLDWVPKIPKHWSVKRSKFIFRNKSIKNCSDQPLLSVTQKDGVVLRSESDLNVWNPTEDVSGYKLIEPSNFVISLRSFEGGLELSTVKGIVSPAYTVLEKTRKIDDPYFRWLMKSYQFIIELNKHVTGIRQGKNIGWDDFSNIYLTVPPIEEQELISRYLYKKTSQIDSLVEKIQRKIDLLKENRTSLINHYVTKGLDQNVEMKKSGVEWIGEIPKHYMLQKIKYLFIEKKSKSNPDLKSGSISFGQVVYKDDESIPETTKESYQEVLEGEFLINPLNLNYDLKSLRIGKSKINVVVSHGYIVLQILEGQDPDYFEYLLRKFDVVHMKSLGQGVRQTISFNNLKNEELVIPPIEEQKKIVYELNLRTNQIDRLCSVEEKRISLLQEYRQSLISSVVTGKIQVTEDII